MDTFTPIDLGSLATETKGTTGPGPDNFAHEE
jgi:hypothetical protein